MTKRIITGEEMDGTTEVFRVDFMSGDTLLWKTFYVNRQELDRLGQKLGDVIEEYHKKYNAFDLTISKERVILDEQ